MLHVTNRNRDGIIISKGNLEFANEIWYFMPPIKVAMSISKVVWLVSFIVPQLLFPGIWAHDLQRDFRDALK